MYNAKLNVPKDHYGDFINIVEASSDYTLDPVELCTGCVDINKQRIII